MPAFSRNTKRSDYRRLGAERERERERAAAESEGGWCSVTEHQNVAKGRWISSTESRHVDEWMDGTASDTFCLGFFWVSWAFNGDLGFHLLFYIF